MQAYGQTGHPIIVRHWYKSQSLSRLVLIMVIFLHMYKALSSMPIKVAIGKWYLWLLVVIVMMMMMIAKQHPKQHPGFSQYILGFAIPIFFAFPASSFPLNFRILQGLLQCHNTLGVIFHIYKLRVLKYINFKVPCCASILYFQDWSICSLNFYLFIEEDFSIYP